MSRNLTWCLVQNLLKQNAYLCIRQLPQQTLKRFEHTRRGYAPVRTENPSDIDYQEVKTYEEFLDECVTGRTTSVKTLMSLLDIQRETAIKLTRKWVALNDLTKSALLKNYQTIRSAGAFKTTIRKNVQALGDKPDKVQQKIKCLQQIKMDINSGIALFQLSSLELIAFANKTQKDRAMIPNYKNRIEYLADRFNCPLNTVCAIISKNPEILTLKMSKILEITDFLIDELAMKPEYLLNDLAIYRYSLDHIKDRLCRAQRTGIKDIKPWFVRCPITFVERWEQKKKDWDTLVGAEATLEEHISKIMNCDLDAASSLLHRNPSIRQICIVKLTDMLTFLFQAGYTIHEIYRAVSVLHRLEDSVKYKYANWVDAGLGPPPIRILNASEKYFDQLLQEEIAKRKLSSSAS